MVASLRIVKPGRLGCFYLLLAVVFLSSSHYYGQVVAEKDENFVVAGYLPEYRFYINLNNTAQHLTDLILFSMAPNDEGELGTCCLDSHHFEQARQARANKHENFPDKEKMRIWLSIGGAGRSSSMAKIAANRNLRQRILDSLQAICDKEEIDGVDFDWEAPRDKYEVQDFIVLMWEASKTIRKKGIKLSVALHPGQVLVADFYAAVDRVNLMTYDMITEKGSHHSTIRNTKAAVKVLADSGCPKSKIVVGIPAYGIHGKNPGDVKTYSEIVDALLELDPNLSRDDATQRKSWKGYLFDSPSLVAKKAAIAKEEGLMGVFFWELGQDKQHPEWSPGGMLLETAAIEISGEASDSNTKTEL